MAAPPINIYRVAELHDEALARWGGTPGIREEGCVDRSIGAAHSAEYYAGNGAGPVGLCFVGSLLFYLCKNSCFVDGNKRTALLSTLDVLLSFGLTLEASNDEVRDYCLSIADGTIKGFDEVVRWLAPRLIYADEADGSAEFLAAHK